VRAMLRVQRRVMSETQGLACWAHVTAFKRAPVRGSKQQQVQQRVQVAVRQLWTGGQGGCEDRQQLCTCALEFNGLHLGCIVAGCAVIVVVTDVAPPLAEQRCSVTGV